jgi:thioredoxin-like negative regulator of GroEL
MRTRRLPLVIPQQDYKKLEELAKAHERDPMQQARWMLRQALDLHPRNQECKYEQQEADDDTC